MRTAPLQIVSDGLQLRNRLTCVRPRWKANAIMHGQGFARNSAVSGAMDGAAPAALVDRSNPTTFLAFHNSGQHHPDSIHRLLPASDALGGAKLHCILNSFRQPLRVRPLSRVCDQKAF